MSGPPAHGRGHAPSLALWAVALGATAVAVLAVAATRSSTPEAAPASPARLAWFFKPPSDGTPVERLAARHSELILTGRVDLRYRDRLRAAGWDDEVWQYLEQPFTAAPLDGPCGTFPERWELWDNQVAWNHRAGTAGSNDFCRLIDPNEDWLLHDADGRRLTRRYGNQTQYFMNPGNAEWREFFAERARWALEQWRYDGLFLDDLWTEVRDRGFREYPSDEAYRSAVVGFVEHLRARLPDVEIIANAEEPAPYADVLDGWFYEAFAAHWSNEYQPPHEVVALWELAERDAAAGKTIILVAQGERGDTARQAFAYAAYLMVAGPRVSFRYSNTRSYLELWDYPIYDVALGIPTGPRRRLAPGTWMREFTAGAAVVNLSDEPVRADVGTGFETSAGAPVPQLDLPPHTGVLLRRAAG